VNIITDLHATSYFFFSLFFFHLHRKKKVFIYDPLYKWMLSPLQAVKRQRLQTDGNVKDEIDAADENVLMKSSKRVQRGSTMISPGVVVTSVSGVEEGNNVSGIREAAERILTRIRQKLQGYDYQHNHTHHT
jgi:hypothetical protein